MKLPNFLFIESSSPNEGAFPTTVSWSLEDGSIKSVMVMPDDDWEPWDNHDPEVDLYQLQDMGVSGPDIIRELNEDLDGKTVFVTGYNYDDELVDKLFETYGQEPGFELAQLSELFRTHDPESILSVRQDIALEQGLSLDNGEDIVRSHVFMAAQIL